ncbi:hypothetical protein IJT17_10105 [bacterium]|nr:hypothetical protein [bacterium]
MPGLSDWFDVFRCGTHTDHSGTQRTISAADIDRAIAAYEPGSAPLVVGHPKLNAPAYGWVESFRRLGDLVQARAVQVAPEFADAVRAGRWKKRSIAFGPDMHFRHVGFLGAAAPAVKGLRDIEFADEEAFMEIETVTDGQPEAVPVPAQPEAVPDSPKEKQDSGDLISALQSELADLKHKLLKTIEAYEAEHTKNVKTEFAAFADGLIADGRLRGDAKGKVIEFMDALRTSQGAEFADADSGVLNGFKTLLNDILTPRVEFAEVATKAVLAPAADSGDAKDLAKEIRSYRAQLAAQGTAVSASQAMAHISGHNVGG